MVKSGRKTAKSAKPSRAPRASPNLARKSYGGETIEGQARDIIDKLSIIGGEQPINLWEDILSADLTNMRTVLDRVASAASSFTSFGEHFQQIVTEINTLVAKPETFGDEVTVDDMVDLLRHINFEVAKVAASRERTRMEQLDTSATTTRLISARVRDFVRHLTTSCDALGSGTAMVPTFDAKDGTETCRPMWRPLNLGEGSVQPFETDDEGYITKFTCPRFSGSRRTRFYAHEGYDGKGVGSCEIPVLRGDFACTRPINKDGAPEGQMMKLEVTPSIDGIGDTNVGLCRAMREPIAMPAPSATATASASAPADGTDGTSPGTGGPPPPDSGAAVVAATDNGGPGAPPGDAAAKMEAQLIDTRMKLKELQETSEQVNSDANRALLKDVDTKEKQIIELEERIRQLQAQVDVKPEKAENVQINDAPAT